MRESTFTVRPCNRTPDIGSTDIDGVTRRDPATVRANPASSTAVAVCSGSYRRPAGSLQLTKGNPNRFAHFRVAIILGGQQCGDGLAIIQLAQRQRRFLAQVADAVTEGVDQRVQGWGIAQAAEAA